MMVGIGPMDEYTVMHLLGYTSWNISHMEQILEVSAIDISTILYLFTQMNEMWGGYNKIVHYLEERIVAGEEE